MISANRTSNSGAKQPRIRVAIVAADIREEHRKYELPNPRFGSAQSALLEGMAEVDGLEVHVITCVRKPLSAPERLADNVYFHSCVVPWWGWLKLLYLPCIFAVRRKLQSVSASIVHGQGTERYCALSAISGSLPSLVTVHGNMRAVARALEARRFDFHGITAALEARTLPRASGVLCLNEYTKLQVGTLAKKTWVIPNAVGSEFFDTKRVADSIPRLFCPALICQYKNQNMLIKALDSLAAKHRFVVSFAGAMPDSAYAEEFRTLISSRSWCEYEGELSGGKLKEAYSKAAMVVLPSLEDNCPMAILEAMAMGIPIAGARTGGIPDLIVDGVSGVLFDPRCSQSIAAAISNCLCSPRMLAEMGIAARARADRFHRPGVVAEQHAAIYRELLSDVST